MSPGTCLSLPTFYAILASTMFMLKPLQAREGRISVCVSGDNIQHTYNVQTDIESYRDLYTQKNQLDCFSRDL